jgi:ABC-2 type transport system ATP-binding protein
VDRLKSDYRRLQVVFENPVSPRELAVEGVKDIQSEGKLTSMLASHNLEQIVDRLRSLSATDIDVLPVSLKEIFLCILKAR